MKKGFLLLWMSVLTAIGYAAPYQLTVTPGNLKNLLRDNDIEPEELVLSGSLNSEDLVFIREGQGRISRLKNLDLSKITFSYDDGKYASFQWTDYNANSVITENFFLSDNIRTETNSGTGSLGIGYVIIDHYTNDLSAFLIENQNIKILTLPEIIQEFGPYICSDSKIEEVTFPDSNIAIPNSAFASTPIQKVNGKGINKIGNNAFASSAIRDFDFSNINELGVSSFNRSKLQGDLILNGIKVIPAYCFSETEITNVTIKNGTKEIGNNAFSDCYSLTKVVLPDGIEALGNRAFNSNNLTEINLPSSLVNIGSDALPEKYVDNMPADDGVVYIGAVAYCLGNSAPEVLRIKEGTLTVSNGFSKGGWRIPAVRKIILPSSLTTIEDAEANSYSGSFSKMTSLEEIEFSSHSNLKYLGRGAFSDCTNLKNINLPEGLLSVGDNSFYNCTSIKNIYLPNSLERIGDEAFTSYGYNYSGEIQNFPDNVQYIGTRAFAGCRMPSTITLGRNIIEIKGSAFYNIKGCYTLNLDINKDYKYFDDYGNEYYSIFEGSSLEKVNVKSTCEIVPPSFFSNCQDLEIVNFENPDDSQVPLKIYSSAFSNGKINIDHLPMRITEIGASAFSGVKFQQKTFDSSNITYIGANAFYNSTGFEKVILNGILSECWSGAFSDIETLKEVKYNTPELKTYNTWWGELIEGVALFSGSPINKIEIGKDVDSLPKSIFAYLGGTVSDITFESREDKKPLTIGESAFFECGIEKLILPDYPVTIGSEAFTRCKVTELDLGGTVSIENNAFAQNYGLTEVEIPSTVKYIGTYAFGDHTVYPLYKLTFESREETKTPLEIADWAFYEANIIDLILPDVPTTIGERAFYRNSINELHLGIGTTTIGKEAFQYNTSLFDVNIPQTVTYIGEDAFYKGSGIINARMYFYSEVPPEMDYRIAYPGTIFVVPEKSIDAYRNQVGECYPYSDEVLNFLDSKVVMAVNEESENYVIFKDEIYEGMPWVIENSNPDVVTMTLDYGSLTFQGLKEGYAEITAKLVYNDNITTKCQVVVGNYNNVESVKFLQERITLVENEEMQLDLVITPEDAIYSNVKWESSDSNIAIVSDTGRITAISPGTANITAFVDGFSAVCEVTVEKTYVGPGWIYLDPSYLNIGIGESKFITATVYPENASYSAITWSSSNPDIAEVSENGMVTGISIGNVIITASCGDVYSECEVEVTYPELLSFLLSPNGAVMDIGDEIQLNVEVYPENAVYPPVEWSSSDNSVATVSDSGLVTGIGEGECVITASCESFQAFCYITINPDSGVESLLANPDSKISVYTVDGILVKKDCKVEDLKSLLKGIYIIVSEKERYKISI